MRPNSLGGLTLEGPETGTAILALANDPERASYPGVYERISQELMGLAGHRGSELTLDPVDTSLVFSSISRAVNNRNMPPHVQDQSATVLAARAAVTSALTVPV